MITHVTLGVCIAMSEKKDEVLQSFKFHMPVDIVKSKSEEDEALDSWKIQGIASTDDEDLQGETVNQTGLDISLLKAGRGLFNHDHKGGPENILGQIEDADFIDHNGKRALFVKGYLFKNQERAKAYYNIMRSIKKGAAHRVHFSIEGKILQRSFDNPKAIAKARIDKVALTLDPVNPITYCTFAKSLAAINDDISKGNEIHLDPEVNPKLVDQMGKQLISGNSEDSKLIEEAMQRFRVQLADHKKMAQKMEEQHQALQSLITKKAMAAGAGYGSAPEARTGGEALTTESLDKDPKKVARDKKKKKRDMLKSIVYVLSDRYPDLEAERIAEIVVDTYKSFNSNKDGSNE